MSIQAAGEEVKVIVFQIMDKEYAIPVHQVRAIEKVLHLTRVPRTVPFIKGVINLRGVITPIIDLRSRFELEETVYTESTRIIIVSMEDMEVGIIVDAANDVIDIPAIDIEPQPEVVGTAEAEYISGVAKVEKRLLILVNLEKVLKHEQGRESIGMEG
ncbi:chemotaxis protein CheW [Peribacillus cavernae]|uniref:Chemotaxis protein CheW n=1 Tax=Peribacillus cavernae TaxID=1674310 RepID=A0A3S0U5A5_9BACI|nr:chemotaxis protein CheW [Peribacillus cavernae]MDQ0217055.1 purine-binding chemotaxis protein CheW [Peribacillus cavernae]RUQ30466.1 chemotaxis protein CheW [Peribacillus cavernae]